MPAIKFKNNRLFYFDQSKLPSKEVWRECKNLKEGFSAIKYLKVRGAPLIGVFSVYCICIAVKSFSSQKEEFFKQFKKAVEYLRVCRPTAVNLSWALERLERVVFKYSKRPIQEIKRAIFKEAAAIHREDVILCKKMADAGAKLIKKGDRILTHCNAGFLATTGEGTALAVIYKAYKIYGKLKVYVDETRPLLQGARLTAWELMRKKIPCILICDNMAAYLMQHGEVDKVFVGADRIAACGDAANKIGTYNLAVIAAYHKVPFYVVAPFSSFDLSLKTGKLIPIEQRSSEEVRKILGKIYASPKNVPVFNPAFDVTPSHLISAIVSDRGVIFPPFRKNIKKVIPLYPKGHRYPLGHRRAQVSCPLPGRLRTK
ncbi:MAG: S-methyl-5-thioribose-1-phosphate isomerase [Candidatus Omnitrophica bacterium]|nr:S-methyl-5-thioribose-1-phosphate isomerase [Candidatus Omnitrophota bacterium]MBU1523977.1 S-methyl-5-thioribose-1-phosphate isomerase [Candidatus Omnitrophota bacterium]MBU2436832.1 S-methyl-5-thioribose-1-phosphate isomerase [Candidatus Omnitrophota bacterium]